MNLKYLPIYIQHNRVDNVKGILNRIESLALALALRAQRRNVW